MKLVSFNVDQRDSYGILTEEGIVDLGSRLEYADLKSLLAAGVEQANDFVNDDVDFKELDVQLLPPIPNPAAIWGVGMNTYSHMEEVAKVGIEKPYKPVLLPRFASCLVPSGQALEKPKLEGFFDYEGEIAVVIGKPCRNVTAEEAMDYIGGYSVFNDASCREYQLSSNHMTAGKSGFRTGGFGPCLLTPDGVDISKFKLTTKVNGEVRQRMTMDDLIFSFGELIAFISEFTWLQPGDVLVTGSAAGPGLFMQDEAKKRLLPGYKIEIEVSGIGTLVNTVEEQQL